MIKKLEEAIKILALLDFPKAQYNERSALTLLALLNITPAKKWKESENPCMGITPIMEFAAKYYKKNYKPNTRETFRRQTMHQFVAAGIAVYNPDDPNRPTNSPHSLYQIEPQALELIRNFGTKDFQKKLTKYQAGQKSLASIYANERIIQKIPVRIDRGIIELSPGEHSLLIKAIIEEFAPRFAPASILIYVGDTGKKWGYFDEKLLKSLGVKVDSHGKMPDVVMYFKEKKWLLLIESVTSHGPVDGKRHAELASLFKNSKAGLVYITAFPTRAFMTRYLGVIAWETEVWCADAPTHLIHFNGERFLGPYTS